MLLGVFMSLFITIIGFTTAMQGEKIPSAYAVVKIKKEKEGN